jgi:Carboxypeptidase regulatory-like domain/TonB dependent receptor
VCATLLTRKSRLEHPRRTIRNSILENAAMGRKFLTLVLASCVSTCFLADDAIGQSLYGEVSGRFTDALGNPIAGAEVTVTSQEKGNRFRTSTNKFGNFQVTDLVPDTYSIAVEANGFKTFRETEIPVFADQASRVNASLPRGESTDLVLANSGDIDILKTDRTDVATLFSRRSVADLPLRDLNVTRLGLFVPGSLPATSLGLSVVQNPQSGNFINVNGQLFVGTAFQLDGTDNRDPLQGLIVINPNLESVGEVKVTTQNYSAEFGEATAGVVTIQTRSGTNSWHGSAFDFRRTGWGQATDPFSTTPPAPIKRNEFGASIGGPLIENRLFVFGDYEGTRQSNGLNQLLSVPTLLVHQTCLIGASGFCNLHEYLDASNSGRGQVYNPSSGMPFKNNEVPRSLLNEGAVNLLTLLPLPNTGAPGEIVNNFIASGARILDADQFDTRVDFNATEPLRILARYSLADFRDNGSPAFGRVAGGAGTNQAGFAGIAQTRNQGISAGLAYKFRPNLLTDFRFGFFRYHLNLDSPDLATAPATTIAKTPGLNNDLFSSGMPDFELPGALPGQQFNASLGGDYLRFGYSPAVNSCNCPLREHEQQFQWVNNWTMASGKHSFKWGADIRLLQNFRLASDRRRAGHLVFSANTTSSTGPGTRTGGLSLATFLFGAVSSFDRFYANPENPAAFNAGERQKRWFFYGQDTWRVLPRLTINFGLRWEIYFPQTVTRDGAGGFLIPNFTHPAQSLFNVPGTAGVDRSGNVKTSLTNFGPRLGVAYLATQKTVIRAGYGRSFDVGFAGSVFGISATQNPPVMIFQSLFNQGSPVFTLGQNPPPYAFTFPSSAKPFDISDLNLAILENLGIGNASATNQLNQSNIYAIPGRVRLPTVDAWNFTIQRQLFSTSYIEVGYVGNKGTHVFPDGVSSYYDLNQAKLEGYIGLKSSPAGCATAPKPSDKYCVTPKLSRQRFNPWGGQVRYFGNDASNNYNSLQVKLNKSFHQGYDFLAHYTWAKGLNYDSTYFNVDPSIARMGYGPSNFDRTHAFALTNLWTLPVGRGKALLGKISPAADRVLGGWAINAATVWYSGLPFSPTYSACSHDRDTGPCRPNVAGIVHIGGDRKEWFTSTGGIMLPASRFDSVTGVTAPGIPVGPWQEPAPGTFGNAGRNSLRAPSFFQSDLAFAKDIVFTERVSLRFRADVFNAFNKVNLGYPGGSTGPCVDCRGGAAIQSLTPGAFQRQLQFSLKLQF